MNKLTIVSMILNIVLIGWGAIKKAIQDKVQKSDTKIDDAILGFIDLVLPIIIKYLTPEQKENIKQEIKEKSKNEKYSAKTKNFAEEFINENGEKGYRLNFNLHEE